MIFEQEFPEAATILQEIYAASPRFKSRGKVNGITHTGFLDTVYYANDTNWGGRNDPCFCGSGKKLKKCHLKKN